ncbi:MAG: right-handed parallel beta-helix repeat-containing protein [Candidatus Bathyarchaeota archaeon]|nr:right-handed parallel beta-helix repeat-containing protein [Candidatus Bathyarchaeota archaeon]
MKPFSMSKKTVYTVIITLFLLIILSLKVENQSVKAEPDNITVPDDYAKIQWAIGNATAGDTIFVRNETYYEHLNVNKPLTLVGESKESTIVDGSGTGTVIKVTARNVVISGFTVQNGGSQPGPSYAGIWISRPTNLTGNHITKNSIGIYVNSFKCNIAENSLTNNGHGISLHSSSEVTVEANHFTANTFGISLVASSSNNVIVDNNVTKSYSGGHGIFVSDSFDNAISKNYLIGNFHGMWLSSSSNNSVLENTIANNKLLGIELANSPDNTFYHNNFINNGLPPHAPSIKHVTIDSKSESIWDDGYPSGGNYWHDYTNVDEESGPNQDQAGGDEIWDDSYVINENNRDRYPSVRPYGDISHVISDEEGLSAQAGPDRSGKVGTTVSFDARDSTGNIVAYEWDFGDGTTGTGVTLNHTYHETGTYTVTLTIRDAAGNIDKDQLTITVITDNTSPLFDSSSLWISALAGVIVIVMVAALFWKRKARNKRRRPRKHY